MFYRTGMMVGLLAAGFSVGCGNLSGLFGPKTTTIELINEGTFPVEAHVFHGSDQNAEESVLREFGEETTLTINAGQTQSITRDCDDIQAIVMDADLSIIGEIGPQADTDVLRDGDNFNCGDIISFRFTHSALIVDFKITTAVR